MYVLGFTKQYYTLWSVSIPQKVREGVSNFIYRMAVTQTYLQNLSMNYEEAIKKIENISRGKWEEDLSLRGCTTFVKFVSPKLCDLDNDQFTFGKFAGKKFGEVADVWQLERAMREEIGGRRRVLARRRLLELNDLIKVGRGKYLTPAEIKAKKMAEEKEKGWGFYFAEGERVEMEISYFDGFSFETMYGTCFIDIFQDREGRKFMYKGSNPITLPHKVDFFKVKGTIKHNDYNGKKQTLLQRMKIIS